MDYEQEQIEIREGKRVEVKCPDCKVQLAILIDIRLEFLKHQ